MIKVSYVQQVKVGSKWVNSGEVHISEITLQHFKDSFVKERWNCERRYSKKYTKYGYFHTKTIVNLNDNCRSVREFDFGD